MRLTLSKLKLLVALKTAPVGVAKKEELDKLTGMTARLAHKHLLRMTDKKWTARVSVGWYRLTKLGEEQLK